MGTPYTYYVHHLPTGLKYYGVKYAKNADPKKFWKPNGYFTSSIPVKHLIKMYGPDSFFAEVRKIFTTRQEAVDHEQAVLKRLKVVERSDWLNQAYGTGPYINHGPVSPEDWQRLYGWRKGIPKSEEHKRRISEAHRGKKHPRTPEWSAKISANNIGREPWNKGGAHSEEARKKMSESRKGRPGRPMTEEMREKIRVANTGRVHTEEHRQKIAETQRGSKRSSETKQQMSESAKKARKEATPEQRAARSAAMKATIAKRKAEGFGWGPHGSKTKKNVVASEAEPSEQKEKAPD